MSINVWCLFNYWKFHVVSDCTLIKMRSTLNAGIWVYGLGHCYWELCYLIIKQRHSVVVLFESMEIYTELLLEDTFPPLPSFSPPNRAGKFCVSYYGVVWTSTMLEKTISTFFVLSFLMFFSHLYACYYHLTVMTGSIRKSIGRLLVIIMEGHNLLASDANGKSLTWHRTLS